MFEKTSATRLECDLVRRVISRWFIKLALFALVAGLARGSARAQVDVSGLLSRPLLVPDQPAREAQTYVAKRLPPVPQVQVLSLRDWEREAAKMRQEAFDRVIFTGHAAKWRTAQTKAEWQETITRPGYRIRKVRFEAVPGMWVPALLYEPDSAAGKQPAVLNFNGHDPAGKAAVDSQTLCINLAKRGLSVLNVEWFGSGQLAASGFAHGRLNQLDLTGTSGVGPFYLAMSRALDLLLAQPGVDPQRVGAVGFDGGGWQALLLGALDTRVRLVNPVAGYASLYTSLRNPEDLHDSEYLPYDLCTVGDYLHFTVLLSPRPLLLTYNAKDPCCFDADRTLSALVGIAGPYYKLADAERNLSWFNNEHNGAHAFDRLNRERFYRVLGENFLAENKNWSSQELECTAELRTAEELSVPLPAVNETFHSLAEKLAAKLPREPDIPGRASRLARWQDQQRVALRDLVRAKEYPVEAESVMREEAGGLTAVQWRLHFGSDWTVPATELARGTPKAAALVVADQGRKSAAVEIEQLLNSGLRVLAVDPFGFGESRPTKGEDAYPLLIAALGDRPLGVQASQVAAMARWAEAKFRNGPLVVVALGPRTSLISLVAAGVEENAIGGLELHGAWVSLKDIIKADWTMEQAPEAFCPGLLEQFDVPKLEGLVKPRPLVRRAGN